MFQPAIKWTGSKRSQAHKIISLFPKEIETYYEPFVGGGSVLFALLNSDIKVNHFICSDINSDLISLWNEIKKDPIALVEGYKKHWLELNKDEDGQRRKDYYTSIRNRFNKEKSMIDFVFLNRNAINGLIRYNQSGEFNSAFHFSRKGIEPENLREILTEWSTLLNEKDVEFICRDFKEIETKVGDVLYCDPPYAATKGMYYGVINFEEFFDWIGKQSANSYLSFDGMRGDSDFTYGVPTEIVESHLYLDSGSSSFSRLKTQKNEMVKESLYIMKQHSPTSPQEAL